MTELELQNTIDKHLIGYSKNRTVLLFNEGNFWIVGILKEEETIQTAFEYRELNYFEKLKTDNALKLTAYLTRINLKVFKIARLQPQQRVYMLRLVELLETLEPESFSMQYYRANARGEKVEYIAKDDCGSIGSPLGWLPFVEGLEPIDSDFKYVKGKKVGLDFPKYAERVLGLNFKLEWWCFACNWVDADNTLTGACARIRTLLDADLPDDWHSQILAKK